VNWHNRPGQHSSGNLLEPQRTHLTIIASLVHKALANGFITPAACNPKDRNVWKILHASHNFRRFNVASNIVAAGPHLN